jgi:hypothetical protein
MPKDKPRKYTKESEGKKPREVEKGDWTKRFFETIKHGGVAGRQTKEILEGLNKKKR